MKDEEILKKVNGKMIYPIRGGRELEIFKQALKIQRDDFRDKLEEFRRLMIISKTQNEYGFNIAEIPIQLFQKIFADELNNDKKEDLQGEEQ